MARRERSRQLGVCEQRNTGVMERERSCPQLGRQTGGKHCVLACKNGRRGGGGAAPCETIRSGRVGSSGGACSRSKLGTQMQLFQYVALRPFCAGE